MSDTPKPVDDLREKIAQTMYGEPYDVLSDNSKLQVLKVEALCRTQVEQASKTAVANRLEELAVKSANNTTELVNEATFNKGVSDGSH